MTDRRTDSRETKTDRSVCSARERGERLHTRDTRRARVKIAQCGFSRLSGARARLGSAGATVFSCESWDSYAGMSRLFWSMW